MLLLSEQGPNFKPLRRSPIWFHKLNILTRFKPKFGTTGVFYCDLELSTTEKINLGYCFNTGPLWRNFSLFTSTKFIVLLIPPDTYKKLKFFTKEYSVCCFETKLPLQSYLKCLLSAVSSNKCVSLNAESS